MGLITVFPRAIAALSRAVPAFRGKQRLTRAMARALGTAGEFEASVDGIRYALDTRELIEFRLAYLGAHEPGVRDAVLSAMARKPNGVFWDIGANVGAIALPVARAFPQACVVAFEPSPRALARLVTNLRLNRAFAAGVTPVGVALASASGMTSFAVADATCNGGTSHITNGETCGELRVATFTGDEMIGRFGLPRPDLVKIDVEGFELEVLQGLVSTLTEGPAVDLVFEHSAFWLKERGLAFDVVTTFLESRGYRLEVVGESGLALSPAVLASRDLDVVARRSA